MKNLILVLTSVLLVSCGARKVNKADRTEEKVTVEVATQKDSVSETVKEVIKIDINTHEVEIMPIDPTKEFVIEGKKYFNARIKIKKKKDNTIYSKENKASKTSLKQSKIVTKETKKDKVKIVDKKEAKSFLFYLSLWIVILLLIVWVYKKFKNKLF